jgi:hypothetical protein
MIGFSAFKEYDRLQSCLVLPDLMWLTNQRYSSGDVHCTVCGKVTHRAMDTARRQAKCQPHEIQKNLMFDSNAFTVFSILKN